MKKIQISIFVFAALFVLFYGCGGDKPEMFKPGVIAENEFDPEVWGKIFPLQYESWLKTKEPKPAGLSLYRKGWDDDKIIYDKLSEMPYLALLFNGWGFGIEYNEPRGHYYAVIDQIEIDPSRTKPGGVCLACKSPMHKTLTEQKGMSYLTASFKDALNMMPEKIRNLGPACIDCHKPSDMVLKINKAHLEKGLKLIGKEDFTRQEQRMLACAQCHITYFVPRDKDKKVAGDVMLPWSGAKWGDISIEGIIKDLLSDFQRLEWKQAVTGFDMPFIRHPEFEMFTRGSVHFRAGLACPDCHMPYRRSGSYKISTHDVTSPVKQNFVACAQCHTESADWLKKQLFTTQEKTASLLNRAGYANARVAKFFELLHGHQLKGIRFDEDLYKKAKESYMQSMLRLNFVSAENSMGFHNPMECSRILGDSIAFANKAEMLLRQNLVKSGVAVPEKINLEIGKYIKNRGIHKRNFEASQEFKDPFGTEENFTPRETRGL
jgi:nitrite reductase (cytochrome c-552)